MITRGFHSTVVQWLRDERRLSTSVVPHELIADPTDTTWVPGSFARPSRAATYAFSGLWVLTAGLVLSMLGMPKIAAATRNLAHQLGYAAELAGVALLVLAYVTLQRQRDRALVEVRPKTAEPATVDSLKELHASAKGALLWLVSERVPEPAVRRAAAELGVRCFAPDRGSFRELPVLAPDADGSAADPAPVGGQPLGST